MSIAWYLAVSAIVFSLGALGVITRRNPLVVLLCLELMLNGANLALIAFSRMWGNGDGQILAIVVMTVAACEVCIGLGMIVAITGVSWPSSARSRLTIPSTCPAKPNTIPDRIASTVDLPIRDLGSVSSTRGSLAARSVSASSPAEETLRGRGRLT